MLFAVSTVRRHFGLFPVLRVHVWKCVKLQSSKRFQRGRVTKSVFMFPFMLIFPKHVSEMLQFVVTEKRTKHPPAVLSPSNSIQSINVFSCHKYNLSSIKGSVNCVVKLNVQHLPHRPLSERGSGSCSEWARVKGETACLNVVLFHFSTTSFCSDCRKIDFKTKAIKQLAVKSVKWS